MDTLALMVVIVMSLALAVYVFTLSWPDPRWRWQSLTHDRNGHYEYGLNMGLALREGDPIRFFAHLEKGKVWPPLHGLLVAAVVAAAGPDHRLAALPSLTGWVLTIVFGYLAARRLVRTRGAGILAGSLAAIFIAASPAHRMFATDVMLESLGAGLSMLTLYLYLRAVQAPAGRWCWTPLAVALTLLFFEKYNYWTLVVLALIGDQLVSEWPRNVVWVRSLWRWPWRSWLARQWREPLDYLFTALVAAVIVIQWRGPTAIEVLGRHVSLYPPENLTTLAYAVLFVRAVKEIGRHRAAIMAWLGVPGRRLLWGHVLPIALSFLLPGRLPAFLWYTSPLRRDAWVPLGRVEAATVYLRTLLDEYHAAAWWLPVVAVLAMVAVLGRRHLRRGWPAVALLAGLSLVLVVTHSTTQQRFLHSWLAAAWVLAGAGAGTLLDSSWLDRRCGLRSGLAAVVVLAVVIAIGPGWRGPGHASGGGDPASPPSTLDIADAYLPYLHDARRPAIFIGALETFARWTYYERYPGRHGLESPGRWMRQTPPEQVPRLLPTWLAATRPDAVVVIDFSPQSRHYFSGQEQEVTHQLALLMPQQPDFELAHRWDLTPHGCTITLWRRRGSDGVTQRAVAPGAGGGGCCLSLTL